MVLAGKNILVTGGTGFIGSHLCKKLLEHNCKLIVPYQSINPKSYFVTEKLDQRILLVNCDLKNFKRTLDIVTKYETDFIFHLAAQSIVPTAFYNPLETVETNIMSTLNILESAKLYGKVKGIIVVSSDKAYGKLKKVDETKPLSGDHPYEISKVATDLLATTYFKTYKLPTVVTRFGNVYGQGDLNFSRVMPGIMKSVILNKTLILRSNGKYLRDYVYVGDVTNALITISQQIKTVTGEAFNISSYENLSVLELIKKIDNILGKKLKYKVKDNAVNEIPVQSISFRKMKNRMGWRPKSNLKSTAQEIFSWYTNYFNLSGSTDNRRDSF